LAEARRVDRAATPSASRGAPVFAAVSTPAAGTPAADAPSADISSAGTPAAVSPAADTLPAGAPAVSRSRSRPGIPARAAASAAFCASSMITRSR
jgi:hypothetical protein